MRQIFAIVAGLSTAVLIIIMAQMIKEGLYPTPRTLDMKDKAAVELWFETLPNMAFWIITISHGLAGFSSGLISSLVSSGQLRAVYGLISASIVFIMVVIFLFTYYFPTWFVITDTTITAVLCFSGVVLGSNRSIA